MAWLKDRADKRQAQLDEAAAEHRRQQQAGLAAQALQLRELIDQARDFRGLQAAELDERPPIVLKPGERIFAILEDVPLIEPRSTGGHWKAGSQGISVHVPGTRSMRYRVGGTSGHYVPGQQAPTKVDIGTSVVTNLRVVFTGTKSTREWLWSKCLALDHQADEPFTIIAVSNRQKASGVGYPAAGATVIRFRLDLALAVSNGSTDALVTELQADLHLLEQTLGLPEVPLAPGSALPPPPAPT